MWSTTLILVYSNAESTTHVPSTGQSPAGVDSLVSSETVCCVGLGFLTHHYRNPQSGRMNVNLRQSHLLLLFLALPQPLRLDANSLWPLRHRPGAQQWLVHQLVLRLPT